MEIILLESNLGFFIGRFHPLLVHLPIGFLLLAAILEFLNRRSEAKVYSKAISVSLFIGSLSAAGAALTGWLLANEGGYANLTLFLHRWSGISIAVLSFLAWAIQTRRLKWSKKVYTTFMVSIFGLLILAGHLGGNLTHGKDYLFKYAPAPIAALMGGEKQVDAPDFNKSNPDSVLVFAHLIEPVMKDKCVQCHNPNKIKGGLLMHTPEGLMEGGDGGSVLVSGDALGSEIFRRVTLPLRHAKFMPEGGGNPMSYAEVQLLKWWIDQGATFDVRLSEVEVPNEVKKILNDQYEINTEVKSFVEMSTIEPASSTSIEQLQNAGFKVATLANKNNFLDINVGSGKEVSSELINQLKVVDKQVTWLDLSRSEITDEQLKVIGTLPNLTRLRLNQTKVTDTGIQHLAGLNNLESLNLYGTSVGDASLKVIEQLPALKKVFLWQTQITKEAVEALSNKKPDLEIDMGFDWKKDNTDSKDI